MLRLKYLARIKLLVSNRAVIQAEISLIDELGLVTTAV
jgi:hypothetical protein